MGDSCPKVAVSSLVMPKNVFNWWVTICNAVLGIVLLGVDFFDRLACIADVAGSDGFEVVFVSNGGFAEFAKDEVFEEMFGLSI